MNMSSEHEEMMEGIAERDLMKAFVSHPRSFPKKESGPWSTSSSRTSPESGHPFICFIYDPDTFGHYDTQNRGSEAC